MGVTILVWEHQYLCLQIHNIIKKNCAVTSRYNLLAYKWCVHYTLSSTDFILMTMNIIIHIYKMEFFWPPSISNQQCHWWANKEVSFCHIHWSSTSNCPNKITSDNGRQYNYCSLFPLTVQLWKRMKTRLTIEQLNSLMTISLTKLLYKDNELISKQYISI